MIFQKIQWYYLTKYGLSVKTYLYTTANNMMLNEVKHSNVVLKHQRLKPKDYTNESPEFVLRKKEFLDASGEDFGDNDLITE